jgi:hypothetical protein
MKSAGASTVGAAPQRDVKQRPFDNILNFRDVGKTINDFLGEKYDSLFQAPSASPQSSRG